MAKCKLIRSSIPAKITGEILHLAWTNPNPTQAFPPTEADRTITLDTDGDYDDVEIEFDVGSNTGGIKMIFAKGKSGNIMSGNMSVSNNNSQFQTRWVAVSADGKTITFQDAVRIYTHQTQGAINNAFLIPQKIYTRKNTLTAEVNAIASSVKTSAQNCMMSDEQTSVEDALNFDGAWVEVNSKLSYKVRSGIVYAHVLVDVTSSNWNSVGVLPTGVRPDKEFTTCIYYDGTYQSSIRVYTNGTIATISNYSGGFRGMISFPLP